MPKELVFKIKADFLKSLCHPARLAIIDRLRSGERSVGRLVQDLQIEQSSLSKHLAILRQSGIVRSRQEKVTVFYSISDRDIFKVLKPISLILKKRLMESREVLSQLSDS